jgi:hypothetical protein
MKKILLTLIICITTATFIVAQAPPQGINYQAIVYSDNGNNQPGLNSPGQVLWEELIGVRFVILAGSANGTEVYKETHATTTDPFGMFSLVIGQGNQVGTNSFSSINWGSGYHFLKVEIDKNGGSNYATMSNQQLWSVPYALYSGNSNHSNYADSANYADLAGNGITGVTDNGNGTLTFTYYNGSTYTTPVLAGLTGPQGPIGLTGATGAVGATGPIGLTGATGSVGATGTPGVNGNNGQNSLVKTTAEPTGTNCATGGTKLEYGLDANNNGTLDAGEINATLTKYICSGAQGTPGSLNAWALLGNTSTDSTLNFVGTTDNKPLIFKNNNKEKIRVTAGGNIGIGTNSPYSKLHVVGHGVIISASGSGFMGSNILLSSTSTSNAFRPLGLYALDSTSQTEWFFGRPYGPGTGNSDFFVVQRNSTSQHSDMSSAIRDPAGNRTSSKRFFTISNNGNVGINVSTPLTSPIPLGRFHVNNDITGSDSSFVVTTDGKVGIGTTNPLGKFHVNNDAIGSDSSFVVTTAGNVGIGTSNPTSNLNVEGVLPLVTINGSGGANILLSTTSTSNAFRALGIFTHDQTSQTEWYFGRPYGPGSGQSDRFVIQRNITASHNFFSSALLNPSGNPTTTSRFFVIKNNGFVGINTDSPDQYLSINGNASKAGGGAWATFSDRRVKQDIKPFNDGLQILMNLKPVTYKYNEKSGYSDLNKTFVGFIAQDVEKVAPYMVNLYDDTEGPSGLNDKRQFDESALSKILVNAVQEQQEQIEALKKEIKDLKSQIKLDK